MDILFLLIPLSVVLVFLIGAVFWLALRGGQFDDLESPGLKVVLDDDTTPVDVPGTERVNDDGAPVVAPANSDGRPDRGAS